MPELQSEIKSLEKDLQQELSLSLPRIEQTFHDTKQTKPRIRKTFDEKDRLHSFDDKPALIKHSKAGYVECMEWYSEGKLHRTSKPARLWFFTKKKGEQTTTGIKGEEWYFKGEYHRTKEPAIVFYYVNGEVENFEYWENGKFIDNPKDKAIYDRGMKKNLQTLDPDKPEDSDETSSKARSTPASIKGTKIKPMPSFKEVKDLINKYDTTLPTKED